jgi:hypothetical protein
MRRPASRERKRSLYENPQTGPWFVFVSPVSADFDFSGGQIENIVRKKTVRALISGQEPTFAEIRELCQEEGLDNQSSRRRIGF